MEGRRDPPLEPLHLRRRAAAREHARWGVLFVNLLLLIGPEWKAYQYSILLHYSLAGVFAFLYLRTLALGRTTSLYGATVFMLGGFGMGALGHVSMLRTYPWLPLVLVGFEMWRRTRDRRHVVLAGGFLG